MNHPAQRKTYDRYKTILSAVIDATDIYLQARQDANTRTLIAIVCDRCGCYYVPGARHVCAARIKGGVDHHA